MGNVPNASTNLSNDPAILISPPAANNEPQYVVSVAPGQTFVMDTTGDPNAVKHVHTKSNYLMVFGDEKTMNSAQSCALRLYIAYFFIIILMISSVYQYKTRYGQR